jgi:hypothetical protein
MCEPKPGRPGVFETKEMLASAVANSNYLITHPNSRLGGCGVTCGFHKSEQKFNVTSLGETTLEIFPNPSTGIFNFNLNSEAIEEYSIKIYDITGKLVLESQHSIPNAIFKLDCNEIANGVYTVEVVQGNFRQILKITKLN